MDDTKSLQLPILGSSKTMYMGHRRWLEPDDPWRKRGDLFNGEVEKRGPPRKRSGTEIKMFLDDWEECPSPGNKKKAPEPLLRVWKTKSIFLELLFYKILDMPHILDQMHITKNVLESFLGTLLNMLEKTKDGPKARTDLKILGIREDLHGAPPKKTETKMETETEMDRGKKVNKKKEHCWGGS